MRSPLSVFLMLDPEFLGHRCHVVNLAFLALYLPVCLSGNRSLASIRLMFYFPLLPYIIVRTPTVDNEHRGRRM